MACSWGQMFRCAACLADAAAPGRIAGGRVAGYNTYGEATGFTRPPRAVYWGESMAKEILVNVDVTETRVAMLEDNVLVEAYYERPVHQRTVGNIYKGRVENVLPGMQAAFVNIGLERNAFLYVADAGNARLGEEEEDIVGEPVDTRHLNIREVLHEGMEIMVQVAKEPIGTKGARVTTHLTLPGRYLVLMPLVDYTGISRRIEDESERERLRAITERIKPPGMGLIVRTMAAGRSVEDLVADVNFLTRLWSRIQLRYRQSSAPALLHKDLGLVYRILRDSFTPEIDRMIIDSRQEYERVMELLDDISPDLKPRVQLYQQQTPSLFDLYHVEHELDKALRRRVWLKSGGYLVIDQTEALTAIDVNTGKFVGTTNLSDTVLRTNLEAAAEIARQLRLRDIGGIIVIDFIDMTSPDHREAVLRVLQDHLQKDRTKSYVLGITQLGLVEMTRKKVRETLDTVLTRPCPYCEGRGRVFSEETMANRFRRELRAILNTSNSEAILAEVNPGVAALLIGAGGANLRELERETGKTVYIRGAQDCHVEQMHIRGLGTRAEVEEKALPVKPGQVLEVTVEEAHATNPWNGIARIEGYVIDIEGAGNLAGETARVEITRAYRTYAKARLLGGPPVLEQ